MTAATSMCYLWLYVGKGTDALVQLAAALSIPSANVVSGDDKQAVAQDLDHLLESGLTHFAIHGDFVLGCDIRLADWALPDVARALQQLSMSGLRIAMADDASDNPFAFTLFESGDARAVTVVEKDESDHVTLFPASF